MKKKQSMIEYIMFFLLIGLLIGLFGFLYETVIINPSQEQQTTTLSDVIELNSYQTKIEMLNEQILQEELAKQKAEQRQKIKAGFMKVLMVLMWIVLSVMALVVFISSIFVVPYLKFLKKVHILNCGYNYFRLKRKEFVETLNRLNNKEDCERILYEIDTRSQKFFDKIRKMEAISYWKYIVSNKNELQKNIEEILQFTDEYCIQVMDLAHKNKQ